MKNDIVRVISKKYSDPDLLHFADAVAEFIETIAMSQYDYVGKADVGREESIREVVRRYDALNDRVDAMKIRIHARVILSCAAVYPFSDRKLSSLVAGEVLPLLERFEY